MSSIPSTSSQQPWWQTIRPGQIALGTVVVLLVVLAFAFGLAIRGVIVMVFLGILLATALRPLVAQRQRLRVPRFIAASVAILLLVGVIIGIVALLAPLAIEQAGMLARRLPGMYAEARQVLNESPYRLIRTFGASLNLGMSDDGDAFVVSLAEQLLGWLPVIGYAMFLTACTLVFTYYWLLYRERSIRGLLLLLPLERRESAESLWLQIEDRIGAFLRGQALLALATALLSLIGYWLVGVPYALLLALVAGLLELIPFLGPLLAAIVATAAGLSVSPELGLAALIVGIVVQQVENVLLAPRIMDRAVGVSPVVTLLAFIGFAGLLGPLGALLAIPLAATGQVLFNAWLQYRAASGVAEVAPGRTRIDLLRYQVRDLTDDLVGLVRRKEDAVDAEVDQAEDMIEGVLADLDDLLKQAGTGNESMTNATM